MSTHESGFCQLLSLIRRHHPRTPTQQLPLLGRLDRALPPQSRHVHPHHLPARIRTPFRNDVQRDVDHMPGDRLECAGTQPRH